MADMTPLDDILNDDAANAVPVQNNFQTIEAYINGTDLIRADGTEVMAANLDMDSNKVVNLANGTGNNDAVNKSQLDAAADVRSLGEVAYASATAEQLGVTTAVDLTSLSVTFTAAATRSYRTTLYIPRVLKNTAAGTASAFITDAVPTDLGQTSLTLGAAEFGPLIVQLRETGLSGSITRKGRIATSGGGDLDVQNSSTRTAYIMVEDLGVV